MTVTSNLKKEIAELRERNGRQYKAMKAQSKRINELARKVYDLKMELKK